MEQFQAFLDRASGQFDQELEFKVAEALKLNNKTLAIAESLTGGLISVRFTKLPGSSEYFIGASVCYSAKAKVMHVGVKPKTLADKGTVSEETVKEMSEGVRKRLHSDLGLAVTGVAGPEKHGGKPVGTVFVALSDDQETKVKRFAFEGSREEIRQQATVAALGMIWIYFGEPIS